MDSLYHSQGMKELEEKSQGLGIKEKEEVGDGGGNVE